MTPDQFVDARILLNLTQTTLAAHLGMSLRAVQDIENGRAALRPIHILALERVSLKLAAERRDVGLALPSVRNDAHTIVGLMP